MAFKKRRLIEAISDRAPNEDTLLAAIQREVWPFLQQVRRLLNNALDSGSAPGPSGGGNTTVVVNQGGTVVNVTNIQASPMDDHLVKAHTLDTSPVGGLLEKQTTGTGLTQAVFYENGTARLRTSHDFYRGPMKAVGSDDAGDSGKPADGLHSHPSPKPDVEGTYLYPALETDTKLREPCRGLLPHGEGVSMGTYIGGGMWQFASAGQIPISPSAELSSAGYFEDGDRAFAWTSVPYGGSPGSEAAYFGIYEVLDCGFHWVPTPGHPETLMGVSSQAVIRRALDANTPSSLCHDMVVQIVGPDGAEYNGDYFQLSTADPIVVDTTPLAFTVLTSYTSTSQRLLLTQAQLSTQSNLSQVAETITATTRSDGITETTAYFDGFETVAFTPGASEFPAGLVQFDFDHVVVDVNMDGTSILGVELFADPGITVVASAESHPINAVGGPVSLQVTVPATAMAITDRLVWRPYLKTTSSFVVTMTVTYGTPYATRVKTPFTFALAGTTDHQLLENRDNVNNHYGVGATTTASGIIPTPTKNKMVITVSGSTTILGMGTAGLKSGVQIDLTFLQACSVVGGATGLGANVAPFLLGAMDIDWTQPTPTAGGSFGVTYYATELPESPCFQLTWGPNP